MPTDGADTRLRRARTRGAWFEPEEVAAYAGGVGPHFSDVDVAFVDAAHAAGLEIHPYTVNEPSEMRRLLALGVGGMFTDAPDRLRSVLGR